MNIYFVKDKRVNRARHALTYAIKHLTNAGQRDRKQKTPYHNPAQIYSAYIHEFCQLAEHIDGQGGSSRYGYFPEAFMNAIMSGDDYFDLDDIVREFLWMSARYMSKKENRTVSLRFLPLYGQSAFDAGYGIDPFKRDFKLWLSKEVLENQQLTPQEIREMWIVEKSSPELSGGSR
jgi:hypothetical protein